MQYHKINSEKKCEILSSYESINNFPVPAEIDTWEYEWESSFIKDS